MKVKALGPKQIMWLRENIPAFRQLEKQTDAARRASITPRRDLAEDQQQPTENTS